MLFKANVYSTCWKISLCNDHKHSHSNNVLSWAFPLLLFPKRAAGLIQGSERVINISSTSFSKGQQDTEPLIPTLCFFTCRRQLLTRGLYYLYRKCMLCLCVCVLCSRWRTDGRNRLCVCSSISNMCSFFSGEEITYNLMTDEEMRPRVYMKERERGRENHFAYQFPRIHTQVYPAGFLAAPFWCHLWVRMLSAFFWFKDWRPSQSNVKTDRLSSLSVHKQLLVKYALKVFFLFTWFGKIRLSAVTCSVTVSLWIGFTILWLI